MSEKTNPVGWFEIPVKDFNRARKFYEHVFEMNLEEHMVGEVQMAWFPMREGVPGAAGTLAKGEGYEPSSGGVLVYFSTPDIMKTLTRVETRGGRVLLSRTRIGEYGYIGIFQDSEGNRIGIHTMS